MENELTETNTYEQLQPSKNAGRLGGRYEIREKLGSGGMSVVHLAYDHKNGCDVAIKFMKSDLGGSARRRFFREFNTIAGIQHPCCLRVFEIGEVKGTPYFTMELHPGKPVNSILGDPPTSVAPALVDLALAVDYIHSQGVVHRDIKPSNVLVQHIATAEGQRLSCKLADFGLAKFYQLDSSLTNERGLVGTPAYCAPEQIEGRSIDHRVDLYALALLAFELLSGGRHPFTEARTQGVNALLHAQLSTPPPKLSEINPNIPESICEIVDSYLAKEPDLRPTSALPLRNVLCDVFDIEVDARLAEMSSPSAIILNAVGFVCREHELRIVDQFLSHTIDCSTPLSTNLDAPSDFRARDVQSLLLVTGDPGTGKTSTMQEAVRRAIGHGFRIHEGRCFDGGTSAFQPVVEIVRQMLSACARSQRSVDESTLLAEHRSALGELEQMQKIILGYKDELLLLAPELRRWLGGKAHEPSLNNDPQYLFRAFSAMFVELSQIVPLCLCFDDIQWADRSTLSFLRHLLGSISQAASATRGNAGCLAVLCTGRSGYPALEDFKRIESRSQILEIELAPLDRRETRELLSLRLGSLPSAITDELVDAIESLCQGNPFFISETIREWHQRGMIVRTTDGWQRVHASLDEDSSLPSTVRSALRTRISDLSEAAHTVVSAAAAIGKQVDLDLLGATVEDMSESALLDAVDELLTKRVFVESNSASRVVFAHDLLREAVQSDLSGSRRRAIHRRIAHVLEDQCKEEGKIVPPNVLAQHYLAGELTEKAFHNFLDAGEQAVKKYLFEDALVWLLQAEEIQPEELAPEHCYRLHQRKANAYVGLWNFLEAEQSAHTALGFAYSRETKGRTYLSLAHISRCRGGWHEAARMCNESINNLGLKCPKSTLLQILHINYNLFAFHFIPRPILKWLNGSTKNGREHSLACEALYTFSHILVGTDMVAYTQICSLNLRLSKGINDEAAKAVAYAKYGLNLAFSGMNHPIFIFSKRSRLIGVKYGRMGEECALRDGRADILAACQTSLGLTLYCAGLLDEAEEVILRADKTLSKLGDLHGVYNYHFARHVASIRGKPEEILKWAKKELELATTVNDREVMSWANYGQAHGYALGGQCENALNSADRSIQLAAENKSNFRSVAKVEEGFAHAQNSDYQKAIESYLDAYAAIKKSLFYFEVVMPLFPRIVEAYLGSNWHEGKSAAGCDWKSARKFARMARFFAFSFPNIRPHTWRMLGRLNFVLGKHTKSRACFERSLQFAEEIGATYDHARTLIDSGIAFEDLDARRSEGLRQLEKLQAVLPQAEMPAATAGIRT